MEGWVKIHRQLLESTYGGNLELIGLFTALLLKAQHKSSRAPDGTLITEGQLLTSQQALAREFNVDRLAMRRKLKKLENAHQIEQQPSNKNSIITIVNWHKFQSNEHHNEHQVNTKRTSSEHQVNTYKNEKNEKNEKNNTVEATDKNSESIKKIVNYLNQVCGKNFKPGTKTTRSSIQARLREGFTVEDFKKVIDVKFEEWGHDPNWDYCLRPITLFGTKFESYLNQKTDEQVRQHTGNVLENLIDQTKGIS